MSICLSFYAGLKYFQNFYVKFTLKFFSFNYLDENAQKELIDIAMKLILGSLDNSTFHVYKSTRNVDCVFSFMEIISKLKDFTLLDSKLLHIYI